MLGVKSRSKRYEIVFANLVLNLTFNQLIGHKKNLRLS